MKKWLRKTLAAALILGVAAGLGSPDDAEAARRKKKVAPKPAPTASQDVMRQAWRAGQQMVEEGRLKGAVAFFRRYLALKPRSVDGWYWLGRAFAAQGDYERAQNAFVRAVAIDPEYPALTPERQEKLLKQAFLQGCAAGVIAMPIMSPPLAVPVNPFAAPVVPMGVMGQPQSPQMVQPIPPRPVPPAPPGKPLRKTRPGFSAQGVQPESLPSSSSEARAPVYMPPTPPQTGGVSPGGAVGDGTAASNGAAPVYQPPAPDASAQASPQPPQEEGSASAPVSDSGVAPPPAVEDSGS